MLAKFSKPTLLRRLDELTILCLMVGWENFRMWSKAPPIPVEFCSYLER